MAAPYYNDDYGGGLTPDSPIARQRRGVGAAPLVGDAFPLIDHSDMKRMIGSRGSLPGVGLMSSLLPIETGPDGLPNRRSTFKLGLCLLLSATLFFAVLGVVRGGTSPPPRPRQPPPRPARKPLLYVGSDPKAEVPRAAAAEPPPPQADSDAPLTSLLGCAVHQYSAATSKFTGLLGSISFAPVAFISLSEASLVSFSQGWDSLAGRRGMLPNARRGGADWLASVALTRPGLNPAVAVGGALATVASGGMIHVGLPGTPLTPSTLSLLAGVPCDHVTHGQLFQFNPNSWGSVLSSRRGGETLPRFTFIIGGALVGSKEAAVLKAAVAAGGGATSPYRCWSCRRRRWRLPRQSGGRSPPCPVPTRAAPCWRH